MHVRFGDEEGMPLTKTPLLTAWVALIAACGSPAVVTEDVPPTLTAVTALPGGSEDTAYPITYAALAAAADEAADVGKSVSFRLESVVSGTLVGAAPASSGDLLSADSDAWTWTPEADASGTLGAFTLKAFDGTLASAAAVEVFVEVAAVNDAPELGSVALLTGALEDAAFTITYQTLLNASDASDVEGPLSFRVESVVDGTLRVGGIPAVPGVTLLESGGTPWGWTPPAGEVGDITAFTVVAFDGSLASALASVTIQVAPDPQRPTLSAVAILTGALPNVPFEITYPILAGAADEADAQGDAVSFRVEAVLTGTLTQDGAPVTPGTSLLGSATSSWVFVHDAPGTSDAFTLVADDGVHQSRTPVIVQIEVMAPAAFAPVWIGGMSVAEVWGTNGRPAPGRGDGTFDTPTGAVVDGGYLYVADYNNHRVQRFVAATGVFAGWIGRIATSPIAGEAGCAGAAANTFTPGWCVGGSAMPSGAVPTISQPAGLGVHGGLLYVLTADRVIRVDPLTGVVTDSVTIERPAGIAFDDTHFYVTERLKHRVTRVLLASGALDGWTGRVGAQPPTACAGGATPAADAMTFDWCLDGTSQAGAGDGAFSGPQGLAAFEETAGDVKLVVADYDNHRLVKLDAGSGIFEGWLGAVGSTTPALGGDCAGEAVGYVAQGWCQGGATAYDTGMLGGFLSPSGTHIAGGKIYQADSSYLARYDAPTGAFEGWIGVLGYTPPDACLNGIPSPFEEQPSGSWCTGGQSIQGAGAFGATANVGGAWIDADLIYLVDLGAHRIHGFDVVSGAPTAWLGGHASAVAGWSTNDYPGPAEGRLDGMLATPFSAVVHEASDALFVTAANRLNKFIASTGEYVGWLGRTTTMPDSCEGALPAAVPGFTGGWCKGGTPTQGYGAGETQNPWSLSLHGDYLLVADQHRLLRYTLDGAAAGWVGTIFDTFNIAPAACAAASPGDFTPDWCTGGQATSGPIGRFSGLAVRGDTLYVSDDARNSVHRVTLTPGAITYDGWTGGVGPNLADVPSTCDGVPVPAPGEPTLGFCLGGTSAAGTSDGMFYWPGGITVDGAGNLYVVEGQRLSKLAADGSFIGWRGGIATSPTGPAASACVGATVVTPGWCIGGSANAGGVDGAFYNPREIVCDAAQGHLYVANEYNHRVDRLDAATGAFLGWAGRVGSPPTGGDLGCTSAARGSLSPGWCTGGQAEDGTNNGDLRPYGLTVTPSHLYVTDYAHHRVTRLVKLP